LTSTTLLIERAKFINNIRKFFQNKNILEVETPLLSNTTVTDPHIDSIKVPAYGYLQTSPEFHMKRLLANGSGSIFQICKAFRDGESGRLHNAEFTMLEWYQLGYNHLDLMQEVDGFLQYLLGTAPAEIITYQELFQKYLDIDPHQITIAALQAIPADNKICITSDINDKDTWLNLLLSHCIEPHCGHERPLFIYNYPASQAALAQINAGVAERFEVYINGIELGNGFHELTSPAEQLQRFDADLNLRRTLSKENIAIDQKFIAALEQGLPQCAGIAMGVDRLFMLQQNASSLADVVSFVADKSDQSK